MSAPHTAPAEAYAPDADRAGPDSSAEVPEWLVHLLALLILFLLTHMPAVRRRHNARLRSRQVDRPEHPPGSAQAVDASVRGPFGQAIGRMSRHRGIGPEHKDWPDLSRAIEAFGSGLRGPDGSKRPRRWWEALMTVPGMIRADIAPTPATEPLLSSQPSASSPPPEPAAEPAVLPASPRRVRARASTGPPTGPPAI
jgi:hypothetical protein